jgi:hypothetical protein
MARHLRVIKGGQWRPGDHQQGTIRLYRPYSIGELKVNNTVFHDVRFNWFCLERGDPVGCFDELIANYGHLEKEQRLLMEIEANRCMLADEVEDLRWYLRHRYGLDVVAEGVSIPIGERQHLIGEDPNEHHEFLQLTENTGYSLLFKACGYYSTLKCLTSPFLESGVVFLMKALQWLPSGLTVARRDLERVVKRLYQEEGFFVEMSSDEVQTS